MRYLRFSVIGAIALSLGTGAALWFWPHRDIQSTAADFALEAAALVEEYLAAPAVSDAKYLDPSGNSRVLILSGRVHAIRTDHAGATVVILRAIEGRAGVACTFIRDATPPGASIPIGATISVKGVIRAGAHYSEVLGTYLDAVVEQCALHRAGKT